jgi:hypothetical protein
MIHKSRNDGENGRAPSDAGGMDDWRVLADANGILMPQMPAALACCHAI